MVRRARHTQGTDAEASARLVYLFLLDLGARISAQKPPKKQPGCLHAVEEGPRPPRTHAGRAEPGRAAACRKREGLPKPKPELQDGLRRPQRRRIDRRRGDARDLRDLRVSPVAAAAAIPAARLRRGWGRDGPVRHPWSWSLGIPMTPRSLRHLTACPTSGDVCILH